MMLEMIQLSDETTKVIPKESFSFYMLLTYIDSSNAISKNKVERLVCLYCCKIVIDIKNGRTAA